MIRLYKAYMTRFLKSIYFIGGCIIALAVTYAVTGNTLAVPFLVESDAATRMFFVTAAMVAYFTVFIPVFTGAEYSDGTIRNKVVAGFSQRQIFFSLYLAYASLALIMWICYLAGGIAAGANPFGGYTAGNIAMLFAVMAYIAFMQTMAFRLTKMAAVVIAAGFTFMTCFNMVLFGNAILMVLYDSELYTAGYIASLVYNINALGQWFSNTGFSDDYANPGTPVQLLLSVIITLLMFIIGTSGLKKSDVI